MADTSPKRRLPLLFKLTLVGFLSISICGSVVVAWLVPVNSSGGKLFVFLGALFVFGALGGIAGAVIGIGAASEKGVKRKSRATSTDT